MPVVLPSMTAAHQMLKNVVRRKPARMCGSALANHSTPRMEYWHDSEANTAPEYTLLCHYEGDLSHLISNVNLHRRQADYLLIGHTGVESGGKVPVQSAVRHIRRKKNLPSICSTIGTICCPNVTRCKGEHLNLAQFGDEWATTNGYES